VQGIRTVSIDLDDTLWPIQPVIERAERRVFAWLAEHYPRIAAQYTPEAIGAIRADVMREHEDRLHDLAFLRRSVLDRFSVAAGYGSAAVDDAFAIFQEERNAVELYPDVRPALQRLRSNFTMIALTNGNADLERIGIRDHFHAVVSAAGAGEAKPAPGIFRSAVLAGGADARATVHAGDHPANDVDGARAAGLHAIWVNRHGLAWPEELPRPDYTVADIGELADLLLGIA